MDNRHFSVRYRLIQESLILLMPYALLWLEDHWWLIKKNDHQRLMIDCAGEFQGDGSLIPATLKDEREAMTSSRTSHHVTSECHELRVVSIRCGILTVYRLGDNELISDRATTVSMFWSKYREKGGNMATVFKPSDQQRGNSESHFNKLFHSSTWWIFHQRLCPSISLLRRSVELKSILRVAATQQPYVVVMTTRQIPNHSSTFKSTKNPNPEILEGIWIETQEPGCMGITQPLGQIIPAMPVGRVVSETDNSTQIAQIWLCSTLFVA
jgi:hypothetical protein